MSHFVEQDGQRDKVAAPLMLMLMCTIAQAPHVTDEVLTRAYRVCVGFITRPRHVAAFTKSVLQFISTERRAPGIFHQRMIISEQNLHISSFPTVAKTRTVVLLVPGLVSENLVGRLMEEEEKGHSMDEASLKQAWHCQILKHTFQAVLGPTINARDLHKHLSNQERKVRGWLEHVAGLMESTARRGARESLHDLKSQLLALYLQEIKPAKADGSRLCAADSMADCKLLLGAVPKPDIHYKAWCGNNSLENMLGDISSSDTDPSTPWKQSVVPPKTRMVKNQKYSIQRKNGIRDRSRSAINTTCESASYPNTGTRLADSERFRITAAGRNGQSEDSVSLPACTVRMVVIGDDRTVAQLAREYHALRKKEGRQINLCSAGLELRLFYIPVQCEPTTNLSPSSPRNNAKKDAAALAAEFGDRLRVGQFLGKSDAWYRQNIQQLGRIMTNLLSIPKGSPVQTSGRDMLITDIMCDYMRMAHVVAPLPLYSARFEMASGEQAEEVFVTQLEIRDCKRSPDATVPRKAALPDEKEALLFEIQYTKVPVCTPMSAMLVKMSKFLTAIKIEAITADGTDAGGLTVTFMETSNAKGRRSNDKIPQTIARVNSITLSAPRDGRFTACFDEGPTFENIKRCKVIPCPKPSSAKEMPHHLLMGNAPANQLTLPIRIFCPAL
uniref:Phosphoinositide 3-kinase regulatory subunit 6-like n=1 Tax=Petromyzon marinus TaxID=7757 RepID=A0AAJ7TTL7_PETMA|nr:phosphoinositide 3-kinase regulatory subunit 6-like [Petromyzon marinus]